MKSFTFFALTFLNLSMSALAAPMRRATDASKYDSPTHGPPVSLFSASPSLQNLSSSLVAAAKDASQVLESYPINSDRTSYSKIYGDWSGFGDVR
jgi:hypothetical protein